jgi:hypothetical protein
MFEIQSSIWKNLLGDNMREFLCSLLFIYGTPWHKTYKTLGRQGGCILSANESDWLEGANPKGAEDCHTKRIQTL